MERVSGIEPPCPPWQGGVLPLNYTRVMAVPTRFELATTAWKAVVLPLNYTRIL